MLIKDQCKNCRKELSLKKRKQGEKINPNEIINECIKEAQCDENDYCNFCVTRDKIKMIILSKLLMVNKEDGLENLQ